MTRGPNMKKLIVRRMSALAIPSGGSISDGLSFFQDPERMVTIAKEATEWAKTAIAVVRATPDNPYGDDEEAIAGAIVDRYESIKSK